ncbi:universal stress protein [Metallosphaera tengchongensis]|uniref:Universal stress protein n=1 Tax=Metallosphaera tengchongensis TaxID=1532350 RepID=A0A6N0NRD4_9CREN|nr:universal stress protein [Metallosphaera tengchongensis]QKQ99305.1 universal stress protein [Metallosphaera tengchongensis]
MGSPTYTVSMWFRKILVPIDGSENSMRALELAIDFSLRYGSRVTIFYACDRCNDKETLQKLVKEKIEDRIDYEFRSAEISRDSSISNEILKVLSEGVFDAVIMGARGNTTNSDINTGSNALSVVVNAPVTVIVVR